MMAANYRHIGGGENRLGRHYSRFLGIWPTSFLADQSFTLRKSQNAGSNPRSRAKLRRIQAAASSAAWRSTPISERCRQSKIVLRMTRAACLRFSSAHLRPWARVIAKTPLDDPPDCLAPDRSSAAPRVVRSERGLARRLAKEDRRLSIAPQFVARDEPGSPCARPDRPSRF